MTVGESFGWLTSRQISMGAEFRGRQSSDYRFGIVELRLDSDGKGTGTVLPATNFRIDDEHQIVIEVAGNPNIELNRL